MNPSDTAAILLSLDAGIASWEDARLTEQGIKAGAGFEANSIIRFLFGSKPALDDLLLYNLAVILPFGILSILDNPALVGLGLGGLVARTIAHIKGYRDWKWLLSNPTKKLPVPSTILQKIFGVWV